MVKTGSTFKQIEAKFVLVLRLRNPHYCTENHQKRSLKSLHADDGILMPGVLQRFILLKTNTVRNVTLLNKETYCKHQNRHRKPNLQGRHRLSVKPFKYFPVYTVNTVHKRSVRKFVEVLISGHSITLKLDAASEITLLSR